jgi:non-heme chloroperoxidase
VPQAFLDTVVREDLKVPARVWLAAFEGFFEDDFAGEAIFGRPLSSSGAMDPYPPSRSERPSDDHPCSRLVVYEGAGHALHWERAERFAADLIAFAESLFIGAA